MNRTYTQKNNWILLVDNNKDYKKLPIIKTELTLGIRPEVTWMDELTSPPHSSTSSHVQRSPVYTISVPQHDRLLRPILPGETFCFHQSQLTTLEQSVSHNAKQMEVVAKSCRSVDGNDIHPLEKWLLYH